MTDTALINDPAWAFAKSVCECGLANLPATAGVAVRPRSDDRVPAPIHMVRHSEEVLNVSDLLRRSCLSGPSCLRGRSDDGTQDAARLVDTRPWLPPGRLAPSGCASRRHAASRALCAQRPDCRAWQARYDLLCRWCRHSSGRQSAWLAGPDRQGHGRAGTDDVAAGPGHGHQARRSGDDGIHHVQRAV